MMRPYFALSALLLLLASSCTPPFEGPVTTRKGNISVSFASSAAAKALSRTIVPPADLGITQIDVTITGPGGVEYHGSVCSVSDTCTITDIVPGALLVAATATNGTNTVAAGSVPVDLVPGKTQPVTVTLVPAATGTGAFSFTMHWPESTGAAFVECSLSGGAPNAQNATLTPSVGAYSWTYAATGVASGAYDLFITFRNASGGTVLGAFVESVNIFDNLTSNTWLDGEGNHLSARTFTAEEMKDFLTSLSRLVIKGSDLSTWTLNEGSSPALAPGEAMDLGMIRSSSVSFVPTLAYAGAGQALSYAWNGGTATPIGSDTSSEPLALLDGAAGNTLVITVTSSTGVSSVYTVTMIKVYALIYDSNGATGGELPNGGLYYAGQTVTVAGNTGGLVRPGFAFNGWNSQPDGMGVHHAPGSQISPVTSDITLFTEWVPVGSVEVSFSVASYKTVVFTYGGSTVTTMSVTRSATPLVICYSDSGSTVSGWTWYVDGVNTGVTTSSYSLPISANGRYIVSCTAIYNGVKYAGSLTVTVTDPLTVSYDGNGADSGTVPAGAMQYASGDTVTVLGNTGNLARSGYAWQGWSADPTAVVPTYAGTGLETFVMDALCVTLHAVWNDVAPAEVTGLSATAGSDSVTLSWTPPSVADFAGVDITYTGGSSGSVSVAKGNNQKLITGLVNNATYVFTVKTRDMAGHASAGKTVSAYTADPSAYPTGTGYTIPVPGGGTLAFDVDAGGNIIIHGAPGATAVVIPASIGGHPVTSAAACSFGWNPDLLSVYLPDSITSLGQQLFDCCYNLQSVHLPANITTIGFHFFNDCAYLTSMTIPASVTSIGDGAFYNCGGLTSVDVYPTTPPSMNPGAFACDGSQPQFVSNLTAIYVPAASVAAYKAAPGWSGYAGLIQAGTW